MEGQGAIEHHHNNASDGYNRAHIHPLAQLLALTGEELRQDHRDDGRHGHEDAHISGGVLQEEIEAAAGDADDKEHQLILPGKLQHLGPQSPQGQVSKAHAQGDDLDGGKGLEHYLGQHKAAAPHQGGEQGKQVPRDLLIFGRSDFRHTFSPSSS